MKAYDLVRRSRDYWVQGLADEWGDSPDTMLLVIYDSGDCDTVTEPGERMHRALYDLYQTTDSVRDGDVFCIDGVPRYRCEGVHVLPIPGSEVTT